MARRGITTLLALVALVLCTPAAADARVPCPAEQVAPTLLNAGQVSDAIFCLTNQVRAHFALPVLRRDPRLDLSTVLHSADMALRGFFGHTNPDGLIPGDRARAQGYDLGVGENIAYGYDDARTVMQVWMASEGHCRNILSSAADVGIGSAVGSTPYYTQDFGNYFAQPIDEAPRAACPYAGDLDELTAPAAGVGAGAGTGAPPPNTTSAPKPAAEPDPPSIAGLSLSSSRLRAGRRSAITYTLSAPAVVTFRVQRQLAGRSAGGRCVAPRRANRKAAPCARYALLRGSFSGQGVAGPNTARFSGRLRGKPLAPGRYRLRAIAKDAGGERSDAKHARFVVVSR